MRHFDQRQNRKPTNFTRVNFQIRVPTVRVVKDGTQLGIMPTDQARRLAQDAGLDLVEVAPKAQPPVCHIMDYAKYRYQQEQKRKDEKRKQKSQETKDLRLSPSIQEHDIEIKVNAAKKFLEGGKKVQFNLQYRKREIAHKDQGFRVMNQIVTALNAVANVERPPRLEGNRLTCLLGPKPE